ncbi:hypothetical protein RchiOBHm_Chr7g0195141 [Rosa chinensis]|uniref:Uncharacterized protein n=1 Tax=Rosa chinensis TaxID=74649 RepID=A0A2P6P690_ROSCH|nr:hypothetical protein RchiOBHm_Chr7g0195141 [Rosa chinensis]
MPWSFKIATPRFLPANAMVNHLMDQAGERNVRYVEDNFLPVDVEKILSIPLGGVNSEDAAIWHICPNGHYTVKSGYWFGREIKQRDMGTSSVGGGGVLQSPKIIGVSFGV